MNKPIEIAVSTNLPLYWTVENGSLSLFAQTCFHENGSTRSRRLFTSLDEEKAESVHKELLR